MGEKKLVQVNTVCNTSTGKIMECIQEEAIQSGYDTYSFVGRRKPFSHMPCEKIGNAVSFWIHVAITTFFDKQGYGSYFHTRRMIRRIKQENPSIIHLHNLHGYYLHLPLFFRYLKNEYKGKVFWTFHDCWPFTGHCPHFSYVKCERWKEECHHCPRKREYPISWFLDGSKGNYSIKKKLFLGIQDLSVIVPSRWMEKWVKESFFKQKPVFVIPNGIDLTTFRYHLDESVCRKYGISTDKKILLGVASVWDERKGLDDFIELAKVVDHNDYQIVLVGLSPLQIKRLPRNVVGIARTENRQELVSLYSRADIFVNPSKEESFSLVTVEAMACGTPVIVLDTSAVKELVDSECGIVLRDNRTETYLDAIQMVEKRNFKRDTVRLCAEKYDQKNMAKQIVALYDE